MLSLACDTEPLPAIARDAMTSLRANQQGQSVHCGDEMMDENVAPGMRVNYRWDLERNEVIS